MRHTGPGTFLAKIDAEAWLSAEQRLIALNIWTPPSVRNRPSVGPVLFGEYAETWLLERDLLPRTRAHYRQLLDRLILPRFADVPVKDITPVAVRTWYANLEKGKPTLRAHAYGLLRTILNTAVTDELVASNPCHVRGAGITKRVKKIKTPSQDELARLVVEMPPRYRGMVLLASGCALRFGEITELRRKDVDLKAGVLHIRRAVAWVDCRPVVGKPKSEAGIRDVAIPPHLIPALRAHLAEHAQWGRDGLLFPSAAGRHLPTSSLYKVFYPARARAGLPDLRFHDLRHQGATWAASTGATLAELMARLGHSTPAAAMRYQHAAQGRDAAIAAKMSEQANGS
jgi:integrase